MEPVEPTDLTDPREAGATAPERLARFAETFTGGAGITPMRELLEADEPFTAVFAANDLLALDCIETLAHHGLRCPEDVSVIGFNDMPFANLFSPSLSTMRFSHYEAGRRLAHL